MSIWRLKFFLGSIQTPALECMSIISKINCTCGIACLLASIMMKYVEQCLLYEVLFILCCRFCGGTMRVRTHCLSILLLYSFITVGCNFVVDRTVYCKVLTCTNLSSPFYWLLCWFFFMPEWVLRSGTSSALWALIVWKQECFWAPSPLLDIMHHFVLFMITQRMPIDPELLTLVFHQTAEVGWLLPGARTTLLHMTSPQEVCMDIRLTD